VLGTLFGTRTEHHDIAGSDKAGSDRGVASGDYDDYLRECQEVADLSLDTSYERELVRQEENQIMNQLALQSVHQEHPIYRLIPDLTPIQYQQVQMLARRLSPYLSASSSSFNLEHELELIMTPPRRQQQQLVICGSVPPLPGRPGSSRDGVDVPVPPSPITVTSSSCVSPISVFTSPSPKDRRARSLSRPGTRAETDDPEGLIRTRKTTSDKGVLRGPRK